jgi:hypothetical protein
LRQGGPWVFKVFFIHISAGSAGWFSGAASFPAAGSGSQDSVAGLAAAKVPPALKSPRRKLKGAILRHGFPVII